MTRKTTNILLLMSLIFNLAVFLMFAVHIYKERQFFRAMSPVYHPELRARLRKVQPMHQEYLRARADLFHFLRSEDFNIDTAHKKLDLIIKKQMRMERELGEELINLRQDMSLEDFNKMTQKDRFHPNHERIEKRQRKFKKPNGGRK